ncbi:MAG: M23 family metallopeptidase [Gemmatimonadales bacterium]|nr:M23 family metallopeptidase [Gemmatimonadales bacterium]
MIRTLLLIALAGCAAPAGPPADVELAGVEVAYERLATAMRWHEGTNAATRADSTGTQPSVAEIRAGADSLLRIVEHQAVATMDSALGAERDDLVVRLRALGAHATLLSGEGLTLEEARALQDEGPPALALARRVSRTVAKNIPARRLAALLPAAGTVPPGNLVMPVGGIDPGALIDTYTQSRAAGRAHNAIDIIAPRGSNVVAATGGRVLRLFTSERGGLTVYQIGTDERTVYYYAHLDAYADGVTDGTVLLPGTLIGYVGDTGNATPGNYHLHFAIWTIGDPKRYWDGESINPFPLLSSPARRAGTP